MSFPSLEFYELLNRLEKVERQNRALKRVVVAVLILNGAVVFLGQRRMARPLEAEEFVLKDAAGRVRARLDLKGDSPHLTLLDAQSIAQAAEAPSRPKSLAVREASLKFEPKPTLARATINLPARPETSYSEPVSLKSASYVPAPDPCKDLANPDRILRLKAAASPARPASLNSVSYVPAPDPCKDLANPDRILRFKAAAAPPPTASIGRPRAGMLAPPLSAAAAQQRKPSPVAMALAPKPVLKDVARGRRLDPRALIRPEAEAPKALPAPAEATLLAHLDYPSGMPSPIALPGKPELKIEPAGAFALRAPHYVSVTTHGLPAAPARTPWPAGLPRPPAVVSRVKSATRPETRQVAMLGPAPRGILPSQPRGRKLEPARAVERPAAAPTVAGGGGPPPTSTGPPVTLKAYGYAEGPDSVRKVFVSDGYNIYVVKEGDTFGDQFTVLTVRPAVVEIRDTTTGQTIRLSFSQ